MSDRRLNSNPFRIAMLALLSACLLTGSLRAESPRDELLRLVPPDMGFCLIVQDLRGNWDALAGSPFAEFIRQSTLGQTLAKAPEWDQLRSTEQTIKKQLGVGWPELRDNIFGDAVVLAYRPGKPGTTGQEEGLLLVRAKKAQVLANFVDRINKVQTDLGELEKLEERTHQGVKYFLRVERNHAPNYYCLHGHVFVASLHESVLQQAIERSRTDATADHLTRPLRQLDADDAFLALWLNPRAFEPELLRNLKGAEGAEAAFLKTFAGYWQAMDNVVLSINAKDDFQLNVGIQARIQALPAAARRFLVTASAASDLWSVVKSERTLLAFAGRIDSEALVEAIGEFLPPETRQAMVEAIGQNNPYSKVLRETMPRLGPDIGISITAPAEDARDWTPDVMWAVRVQSKENKNTGQTLLDAINFFAGLAVLDYNSKNDHRLTLKTETHEGVEIKHFVNDKLFAPGWRPAYALKNDYLLFASSPEVIRSFKISSAPTTPDVPILYSSLKALRHYLKKRHKEFVSFVAANQNMTPDVATTSLNNLISGLELFDEIELSQRTGPGRVIFKLRARPSRPLRK